MAYKRKFPKYSQTSYPKRRKLGSGRYKKTYRRTRRRTKVKGSYYKKQGTILPYRSSRKIIKRNPVVRGTSHRQEFLGNGYTSTVVGGNNAIRIELRAFSYDRFMAIGFASSSNYTDFDNYTSDFPTGMRKIFWKGCKLNMRFTNFQENNVTMRVVVCRTRKGKNFADWNGDVHRMVNTRHFKVLKNMKWVMDTGDFTPNNVSGTTVSSSPNSSTMVKRELYIPINKWLYTRDGDPANANDDFESPDISDAIHVYINSDDVTSVDNQYVQVTVNAVQYWATVNDDET